MPYATALIRHLSGTLTADALAIITTPECGHRATLRALAWRTLKAERGQTCDIARLEAMTRPLTLPAAAALRAEGSA